MSAKREFYALTKKDINKMKLKIQIIAMLALGASTVFTARKKNAITGTGSIRLEFENFANGNTLDFTTDYTNANGEQMRHLS
ncbi:MAG: hypothetical protein RL660_2286 [Bacteroidota bacterium]|jgi:hypothetical protein